MRATSVAGLAATLALAGCGAAAARPRHHVHLTAFEKRGKTLFVESCGACHTLADAGTSGSAGPALDQPWAASRVLETIADGPGDMPLAVVTGKDAAAVAAYVAAATAAS